MKSKHLFMILLFLGIGIFSNAQKIDKKIDELVNEKYKPGEPGATVLVADDGEVVYKKAFGMANLELNVPMKMDQVFEIGSITKQFTAISVLMLMEEGKLALEDDITKYIEDYPTHGHTITIHHLLNHTSGIKSYTSLGKWQGKWREDYEPKDFIDFFKNEPMDFAPGEKFSYNNSAYFMLGYIIEKASGKTYPEFVKENIFKPLEMDNSYYGSHSKIIKDRAYGYQKNEEFVNAEYLSMTQPYSAGSLMSTVGDLFKWHKALHSYKLVKKETLEKAFTNYTLNNGEKINYGYGWFINEIDGIRTIEHGGGIFGYTTNAIYIPEEDVFVAMFTNRDDFSPSEVSTKIAAETIGKPYPDEDDRIKLDDEFLRSLTGVYEFEDGVTRFITYEDGELYSQRKGSTKFKIYPVSENKFYFEDSFSTYVFKKKEDEIKVVFKQRINETKGERVSIEIPDEKREVYDVDPEILKHYVGEYAIKPNFTIVITLEEGQLKAKATGQGKFDIYPESETKFYYKVVDAQIEFLKNEEGKVDALMLHQGGQKIKAEKK